MRYSLTAIRLAAVALLAAAGSAQAELRFYTSQASFMAAVRNAGVDTYSDVSASVLSPLGRTAGSYAYTIATSYTIDEFGNSAYDYIHPRTPEGSGDVFLTANQAYQPLEFSGFSNVSAFGGNFFLTAFGSPTNNPPFLSLYVVASDGQYYETADTTYSTSGSFFGLVSTGQILRVAVTAVANTVDPSGGPTSVDNLTLAQAAPVPEPQTYALMLGGLGLLGALASRRR